MAVKKRRYEMANRSRQAAETRRRIVEAAVDLFLRDGYAVTSMNAIAAEAGVAIQTVYASMKTKQDILRAVLQLTVRGEEDEVPVAASSRWREMERATDPREKLAMFARIHREICDREAAIFTVLETAAAIEPELKPLLREKEQFRYEDQARVARSLGRRGLLRTGLSAGTASDIIWTLASERIYLALVQDRGWAVEDFEVWLTDQLAAAILGP
jgi:TetR/AcrR family transcriptional regulator, regulator of autoinduction and epiphytic fitness